MFIVRQFGGHCYWKTLPLSQFLEQSGWEDTPKATGTTHGWGTCALFGVMQRHLGNIVCILGAKHIKEPSFVRNLFLALVQGIGAHSK